MSASFTLRDTQSFPPGTVVTAYQARGSAHPFPGHLPPERGTAPPPGAPVIAEGTMGSESLVLTGLEPATIYFFAGLSGGEWRWVQGRTLPTVEAGGGFSQAEADALYSPLRETTLAKTVAGNVVLPGLPIVNHDLLLNASGKIVLPATVVGSYCGVWLTQGAAGSRVPTFEAPTGAIRWFPNKTVPAWSASPGDVDIVTCVVVKAGFWDLVPALEGG